MPMTTRDKVAKLSTQARILWLKHDPDMNGQVEEKQVEDYLEDCAKNSGLSKDEQFLNKNELQRCIDLEVREKGLQCPGQENVFTDLNQESVINIFHRLYKVNKADLKRKPTAAEKASPSLMRRGTGAVQGDYAQLFQDTKAMGKDKNWSEQKINDALKVPEQTRKQIEIWKDSKKAPDQRKTSNLHQTLHKEAEQKKYERNKMMHEKEKYEEEEALILANERHGLNENHGPVRSNEQLMMDFAVYEQNKYDKHRYNRHLQAQREMAAHQESPIINKKSVNYLQQRNGRDIYTAKKDYGLETSQTQVKTQHRRALIEEEREKDLSFHPMISTQTRQMTQNRGLEQVIDEGNRIQSQKEVYEQQLVQKKPGQAVPINSTSDKVVHDRFDQDFNLVCYEMNLISEDDQQDWLAQPIKYNQMAAIMLSLGFIGQNNNHDKDNLPLLKLWKEIGGDEHPESTVALGSLKNFTRCIQNFHHQEIIDPEAREDNLLTPLGRATENGHLYTPREIEHISKVYRNFFTNRCNKVADDKKKMRQLKSVQKKMLGEEHVYAPQISERTRALAEGNNLKKGIQIYDTKTEDRLNVLHGQSTMKKKQQVRDHMVSVRASLKKVPDISQNSHIIAQNSQHQLEKGQFQNAHDFLSNKPLRKDILNPGRVIPEDEAQVRDSPEKYTFRPVVPTSSQSPRKKVGQLTTNQIRLNMLIDDQKRQITFSKHDDPEGVAERFLKRIQGDRKYAPHVTDMVRAEQEKYN